MNTVRALYVRAVAWGGEPSAGTSAAAVPRGTSTSLDITTRCVLCEAVRQLSLEPLPSCGCGSGRQTVCTYGHAYTHERCARTPPSEKTNPAFR